MSDAPPQDHDMRVYKFAIHGDLPQEAIEEVQRAHHLWNQLVALHHTYESRIAEVWAGFPELAVLNAQVMEQEDLLIKLKAEASEARKQARSTTIPSELRGRVKAARDTLRDVKAVRRHVKEATYEAAKPALAVARSEMNASVKASYRSSVNGGLYWASYNDVLARFRTAQQELRAKRRQGLPAQLRFHRWRGEGTIAVQLQRGADQVAPTPTVVADPESPWKNVMSLTPALDPVKWATMPLGDRRRAARQGLLQFRVGSGDHAAHVEVPVVLHRPIPPKAEIKLLKISRRLSAGKPKVFVSVVVRLPVVPARTEGSLVTVHLGWRSLGNGSTRVAVISGMTDSVPREVREAGVVRDHGDWMEVVTPGPIGRKGGWAQTLVRTTATQGIQSRHLDALRADLVEWLIDHPEVEEPAAATVMNWRSPRRFEQLRKQWETTPPEDSNGIVERLRAWHLQDSHLWTWKVAEHQQIIACRDDMWKKVAAWICTSAALVRLDGWNVTAITPPVEDPDGWQERLARAQRMVAAPATLRNAISKAAMARGVQVERVDGPVSQTHYGCGGALDADARKASLMVRCSECGLMVDQDRSALGHLADVGASIR